MTVEYSEKRKRPDEADFRDTEIKGATVMLGMLPYHKLCPFPPYLAVGDWGLN